jgi:hypothetical protein
MDATNSKRFLRDNPFAFLDHNHSIRRHVFHRFFRAAEPADANPCVLRCSQPEVQAQIILRAKAPTASNLLHLPTAIRFHYDPRPDCRAVGLGANQLYKKPRISGGRLISQQGRKIIQIINGNGNTPGIKDVATSRAASAPRVSKGRSRALGNVCKPVAVNVSQQNQLVLTLGQLML